MTRVCSCTLLLFTLMILLDFAEPLDLLATSVSCFLCHESANGHYRIGHAPITGNLTKTKYYILI